MSLLRRVIASVLSGVLAFGQPAEVLAASYVFRQPSAAGTFPVPTLTNNVVTAATYYKIDGRSYSISWQGTGGRSPYQIEMVGAPLPPGCSSPIQTGSILTSNCVFTTEGNFSGAIAQLTDANGMVVRDNAPNIVVTAPAPTLGTYNFPFNGYVATPYRGSLKVSGGRQPFNASRATGQLPPGLSLAMVQDVNSGAWSVELSGTPTTTGSYTFDILLTDANQKQATSSKINVSVGFGPISLVLRPSPTTGVFKVMAGQPIGNAGVSIIGGTPPATLSQQTGTLPPGLSIGPEGQLEGTPTTVGTTSGLQIKAVDSAVPARTATSAAFAVQVVNGLSAIVVSGNAPYQINQPISPISTIPNGGTAPYSYSLAGDLPPGIAFSKTNGQFSGTPTVAGRYPGLVVTVRDADGFTTDAAAFAMTVANPLIIAGDAPRGVAGNPYSASFTASGGTAPYSFSIAAGDLPFGLSLGTDGTVSGTPFAAGSSDGIVIRVTDADGSTKDRGPFSIVLAEALAVATTPARTATRGVAYSSAFTAVGGAAPYGFALVSGTLPPGLSLASGGTVSGTPTVAGSYGPLTVRLVDADGRTATGETTIVVSPPVAIVGTAGRGTLGQPYAAAFTATGGTGPYAFSLAAGGLPLGLSLASDGTISGSPTAAGTAAGIVVRVVDADGRSDQTQTFSIVVDAPLRIAGSPSAVATLGQTYSTTFAASGGTGPYTFSLATGTLPAGLALAGNGTISGAPSATGLAENLSVKVADAAGRIAVSDAFRISVGTVLTVSGTAATQTSAGQPYSAQFTAAGGTAPYGWTLASGTLPPGLSLDPSNGLVGGTATTLGSYPGIQLRASDADGRTALSTIFGISVSSSLAIVGTPSIFATVGQPYSAQFTATGGAGAKTYSLASGQLPAGLTFDTATGLISGTPTAKGFAPSIAVRVRDETNSAATAQAFDLHVSDPLVVSGVPAPDAIVGGAYSGNATVAGGRTAYAWSLDAGTLPPGLQISPITGVISGTPTAPGTASDLRLRVTDADGRTGTTAAFSITVAAPLTIAGQAGPGTVGAPYAARFAADGGSLPYAYEIVGAALPAGLTLDAATGSISGQPTAAAVGGTMQMRVTDAKGRTASTASFAIDVRDAFRLVGSNLGPATVGLAYSGAMAPAGGRGPFVLSLAAGSLPPGLILEPGTGVVSGTPTAPGSYADIVVAGVDADGRTARSAAFTIEVADGISIAGIPPQPATVGVPYEFAFAARGGQAPYTFALTGGSLPAGVALDGTTGGLAGSPDRVGIASGLTVTAMDRARRTAASVPFTIDVRDPVSVTGSPPLVATRGQPYGATFAAAGGRGPFSFAMIGTLPAGLTLSASSGTISGTATTVADAAGLRVQATDQDGRVGSSDPFTISVGSTLALALPSSLPATTGSPVDVQAVASGGRPGYRFSVSAGSLPDGLVLDAATGSISGTPTSAGQRTATISVADADGRSASGAIAISVFAPLVLLTSASDATATVGQPFNQPNPAAGGRSPYVFAISGTLPPGLSITPATGTIAGTPTTAGTYGGLVLHVTDADGQTTSTSTFSIVVSPAFGFAGLGVPSGIATVGVSYASGVAATGGRGPYSYVLTAGALPVGLTLDGTSGQISGTPSRVETAAGLRITAMDADGRSVVGSAFQIDVRSAVAVSGSPAGFGTISQVYGPFQFAASGGRGPYVYAVGGTLPAGVSLTSAGVLSGTPNTAVDATGLQVRATDADGRVGFSSSFAIAVSPALAIAANLPAAATQSLAYAGAVMATGGRAGYAYSLIGSALPPGLGLDPASGAVTGIPSAPGSYTGIRIRVSDADGRTADTGAYTLTVSAPLSASYAPTAATRGSAYGIAPAVSGGRAAYAYALSSGSLPAGLTLNPSTGAIGGTPTTAQVASNLQVRISDADGRAYVTAPFAITVSAPLSISLAGSVSATLGIYVSTQATINGGRAPFTWSIGSGGAPGVGFNTGSGAFEGTPSAAGSFPSSVSLVDADGRTANASTTFVVVGPLQLAAPSTTSGPPSRAFRADFVAGGGTAPYTYALASGTLPSGLSFLTGSGSVSGTPSGTGSYPIVVRVTDAGGRVATASATIRIFAPLSIAGTPTAEGRVGVAYSGTLTVSGGGTPIGSSFSPALPAGLTAAISGSTMTISGTPTEPAQATYLVTVTDPDGQSASKSFPLLIRGPVQNADSKLPLFSGQPDAAILTVLWDGEPANKPTGSWKSPYNALGETEMRAAASWGNPNNTANSGYNLYVTYDDYVNVDTIVYNSSSNFTLSYQADNGQFYQAFSFKVNAGTDVITIARFSAVRSKKFMITVPQGLSGSTIREMRLGWGGTAPFVMQPQFAPPGAQTGYVSGTSIDYRSTFVGTPGQQVALSATARSAPGAGQPVTFSLLPYTPGFKYANNSYYSFSCRPEGGYYAPKVAWGELECQGRRTGDRNTPLDGTAVTADGLLTIGSVPEGTRDVWISAKDAAGVENHRAVRLMQNAPGADTVRPASASVEWERGTGSVSTTVSTMTQYEDTVRYRVAADLNRLQDGQTVPSGDASRLVMTNTQTQKSAAAKRVVVTYGQPVRADGAVVSFVDAAPHFYESMALSIYAKISGNWQRVSGWIDVSGAGSEVYLPFDNLPVASSEFAVAANVDNIFYAPQGYGSVGITEFRVTYGGRNAVR